MSNEGRNDLEKLDLNKLWETAEHGDAEAQYKVGKCYFEGIGVNEEWQASNWQHLLRPTMKLLKKMRMKFPMIQQNNQTAVGFGCCI